MKSENRSRNIRLLLEYDGSGFKGFQIQPEGRTVQGALQEGLAKLTGERVKVIGASRTDTGVHALGMVANFHTGSGIPAEKFAPALNSVLPADVRVLESGEAAADFHARCSAVEKTYRYLVYRRTAGAVLQRNYSLVLTSPLDVEAMREAAGCLVGTHSFKSFCASRSGVKNFVRTVRQLEIDEQGERLVFTITADGFLYHMVRNIAGTLLLVGSGKMRPGELKEILLAEDRGKAGPTAPAQGLYLVRVGY